VDLRAMVAAPLESGTERATGSEVRWLGTAVRRSADVSATSDSWSWLQGVTPSTAGSGAATPSMADDSRCAV
jgi:hypothetical protein